MSGLVAKDTVQYSRGGQVPGLALPASTGHMVEDVLCVIRSGAIFCPGVHLCKHLSATAAFHRATFKCMV